MSDDSTAEVLATVQALMLIIANLLPLLTQDQKRLLLRAVSEDPPHLNPPPELGPLYLQTLTAHLQDFQKLLQAPAQAAG